jgi:hypothetical protein
MQGDRHDLSRETAHERLVRQNALLAEAAARRRALEQAGAGRRLLNCIHGIPTSTGLCQHGPERLH